MGDFFAFRRMIAPVIIQIVFWLGVLGWVGSGCTLIVSGANARSGGEGQLVAGILSVIVGPLVLRLLCEVVILFFRMNETLTDIKNTLEYQPVTLRSASQPSPRRAADIPPQPAGGPSPSPRESGAPMDVPQLVPALRAATPASYVTKQEVELFALPGDTFPDSRKTSIPPGTPVSLMGSVLSGGWVKVALADGNEGYVSIDALESI